MRRQRKKKRTKTTRRKRMAEANWQKIEAEFWHWLLISLSL